MVHFAHQKSRGLKFSKFRTGSHVTYSCHHCGVSTVLTQLSGGYIYIYIYYLLYREQLHVSALVNGHLKVVYENTFSEQLYKTYIWATYMGLGGGKVGTRSRICSKGWGVHTV